MSAPVLGTCFGFNEDYVDFARKSISDAMFKFSSENSNKALIMDACNAIKNKLKFKYGLRWGVLIFKEKNDYGNASDAENYMKFYYKGHEIIIFSLVKIELDI